MNSPSATGMATTPSSPTCPDEAADHLREILKRCPTTTYHAALQFRKTGHPHLLPAIVLGIIERFVEADLRTKLKQPDDTLRLAEDLGLDSLTLMEIVILVEDVLTISTHNEELRPLRTLGDVRQFIERKVRERPMQKTTTGQIPSN